MSLATLRSLLRSLLGRAHMESDVGSELQPQLDTRVDDLSAGGLDRAAAKRRARHEVGGPLR